MEQLFFTARRHVKAPTSCHINGVCKEQAEICFYLVGPR